MKKIYIVLSFYLILFTILCFTTLSLNYIEGDDASTILYHLCGRDIAVQMPYSSYNSGFDFVLKFLPNDELILRKFAILISFIFGFLTLCYCAILTNQIFENDNSSKKYFFLAILPFIIPDFIFESLIVNTTNISISFALLSTILYLKFIKNKKYLFLILSIILMAISIPFRWSNLVYYPIFISLLIFVNNYDKSKIFSETKTLIIHFCFSLFFGILFIYVTGYNLKSVLETMIWGKKYLARQSDGSMASAFAIASSFTTIPFLTLFIFGLYVIFIKNNKKILLKILFILLPLIPYFVLGIIISYKYLITLLPILLILCYVGYNHIYKNKFIISAFYLTIFGMWFIGIHINLSNTLWGKGYEFKKNVNKQEIVISEKNLDKRIIFNKINIVLDGGFYMPTPEAPRPLFGYFYVIFGKLWKKDLENLNIERDFIIKKLIANKNYVLLQDRKTAFLECELIKNGYRTKEVYKKSKKENILERKYISKKDTITINVISDAVSKADFSENFILKNKNVIFRSSYSSLILNILNKKMEVKIIGPYTVIKTSDIN